MTIFGLDWHDVMVISVFGIALNVLIMLGVYYGVITTVWFLIPYTYEGGLIRIALGCTGIWYSYFVMRKS